MRILVTGANGLAGSAIVRQALAGGHEPVALIRPGADTRFLPPAAQLLRADFTRDGEASGLLAEANPDALIHCAAVVSTGRPDLEESLRVNVEGTRRLLAAAEDARVHRWVQISSMSAHPRNRSIYGGTKRIQEQAVRTGPIPWAVLRPGLIYGPQKRGIFARLAAIIANWRVIPLPGGGREPAAAVHVEDFAVAAVEAATREEAAGQCFELGGPEIWTFRRLVEEMAAVLKRRPLLVPMPLPLCRLAAIAGEALLTQPPLTTDNLEGIVEARWPETSPARDLLGFAPRPFAAGFRQCLREGLLGK